MKPQQTYQAVLGMVIGLSVLSHLLKQPFIAYMALTLAFLSLMKESFGEILVGTLHTLMSFIFGGVLKAVLIFVYLLLLTPIAIIRKKQLSSKGWQIARPSDEAQMKYTW